MAGARFKHHLIHQAVVYRTTQTQASDGELIDSWSPTGTIDCRYVQKAHRYADEGQGFPMVMDHMLLCNQGEDVIEEDRIGSVTFKATGTSAATGTFSIESLLQRNTSSAHHLSIKLQKVE